MADKTLFLITLFCAPGTGGDPETERLVNADSRSKAAQHVMAVNKAAPADVARVLSAGGTVEEATA